MYLEIYVSLNIIIFFKILIRAQNTIVKTYIRILLIRSRSEVSSKKYDIFYKIYLQHYIVIHNRSSYLFSHGTEFERSEIYPK